MQWVVVRASWEYHKGHGQIPITVLLCVGLVYQIIIRLELLGDARKR